MWYWLCNCVRRPGSKPFARLSDEDLEHYMRLAVADFLAQRHGAEQRANDARQLLRTFLDILPYRLGPRDLRRAYRLAQDWARHLEEDWSCGRD